MDIQAAYKILNVSQFSTREDIIKSYRNKYFYVFGDGVPENIKKYNSRLDVAFNVIIKSFIQKNIIA